MEDENSNRLLHSKIRTMIECYFTPKKDTTSATICANCGKEKILHTIGVKVKTVIIISDSKPIKYEQ